jgi:hypothetical protein
MEGKAEIFLTQSRDKAVKKYARHLARRYPTVKRLLPSEGQQWHKERLLHKKEKEQGKVIALGLNQFGASMLEKSDDRFSQIAGMGMGC